MTGKKIAMFTPELYGVAMVGGLAMAVSGLTKALRMKGWDAQVIMPAYHSSTEGGKFLGKKFQIEHGISIDTQTIDGIPVHTVTGIDFGQIDTYGHKAIASYIEDAAYRKEVARGFITASLFSKAMPEVLGLLEREFDWVPDLIHLHEWQTASASYDLKADERFKDIPLVVTSHNPNYIGKVPFLPNNSLNIEEDLHAKSPVLGRNKVAIQVGDELFTSLLELGVFYADKATSVSAAYVQKLLSGAVPIDGRVLRRMKEKDLVGILNGLDTSLMNPSTDPFITQFDPKDMESVAYGKGSNKLRLHEKYHLSHDHQAVQITMMERLVVPKGIDLVEKIIPEIEKMGDVRLLIVGETYDDSLRARLAGLKTVNVKAVPYFAGPADQHLVLAGSDAILKPSKEEPCGYTHLEGMAFGAVPITTLVDGLEETMNPFVPGKGTGYGFPIKKLTPSSILSAINEVRNCFKNREGRRIASANALAENFAWDGPRDSVGKYSALYESLLASKTG